MLTRPSALGTLREQCDVLTKRIQKLEHDNQMAAFEYSKKVYLWERDRLQKERPLKEYNQRLNEHKAKVLSNVLSNLACLRKHINNVTKTVIEVDLEKAKLMVDGLDVTDETTEEQKMAKLKMRDKIEMALEKLQQSSYLKAEIDKMAKAGKICVKSLQSHVPKQKGKYEKSGQFTKEERAAKIRNARPYKKTGNHINDYQLPRFPEQRDKQIEERSKGLGVSQDLFRRAVMGK